MAMFTLRSAADELQALVALLVARSRMTDVNPGSNVMQLLGAVSKRLEVAYIEIARLLELFSIDRAQGADLDERAAEYLPDGLARFGATYAVGTVRWTRPTVTGTATAIPAGTVVGAPDSAVTYITLAAGEIPAGGTQSARTDGPSGDIPARATVLGPSGNLAGGTALRPISAIPGTNAVTCPTPFTGGVDEESDADFRGRIRARTRSLSRCTPEAIETRALDAAADGRTVKVAKWWPQLWRRGEGTLLVDDGTGFCETFASSGGDDLANPATGGERFFWASHRALRGTAWMVSLNGAPLAASHYKVVPSSGLVALSPTLYPHGATAGDVIRLGPYEYFTGLVAETQRLIDGDPIGVDGWVAAGIVARVLPPAVRWLTIDATVVVDRGANRDAVRSQVATALSAYINGLAPGSDAIWAEMVQRAMDVPGMVDLRLADPPSNVPVGDDEVARVQASNIVIH